MKLLTIVLWRSIVFLILFTLVAVIIYISQTYNINFSIYDQYDFVVNETQYHIAGYKSDAAKSTKDRMINIILLVILDIVFWLFCCIHDRINYIFTKKECIQNNELIEWSTKIKYNQDRNYIWTGFLVTCISVIFAYSTYLFGSIILNNIVTSGEIFTIPCLNTFSDCPQGNSIPTLINNVNITGTNFTISNSFKCIVVNDAIDGSLNLYNNIVCTQNKMGMMIISLFFFTIGLTPYNLNCYNVECFYKHLFLNNTSPTINETKTTSALVFQPTEIEFLTVKNETKEISTIDRPSIVDPDDYKTTLDSDKN